MLKLIYPTSHSASKRYIILVANPNIPRKIRLHLSSIVHEIIVNDYRDEFSNKMSEIVRLWDWG